MSENDRVCAAFFCRKNKAVCRIIYAVFVSVRQKNFSSGGGKFDIFRNAYVKTFVCVFIAVIGIKVNRLGRRVVVPFCKCNYRRNAFHKIFFFVGFVKAGS